MRLLPNYLNGSTENKTGNRPQFYGQYSRSHKVPCVMEEGNDLRKREV